MGGLSAKTQCMCRSCCRSGALRPSEPNSSALHTHRSIPFSHADTSLSISLFFPRGVSTLSSSSSSMCKDKCIDMRRQSVCIALGMSRSEHKCECAFLCMYTRRLRVHAVDVREVVDGRKAKLGATALVGVSSLDIPCLAFKQSTSSLWCFFFMKNEG